MVHKSSKKAAGGDGRREAWVSATFALFAALVVVLAGCSSEHGEVVDDWPDDDHSITDAGPDVTPQVCIDEDGDGYGVNCPKGPDCDDTDPNITDECYRCATEGTLGCPCDEEGEVAECGQVQSRIGDQITCGYGWSTCSEGAWGPCIINNSRPLPASVLKGIAQAIGGPSDTCVANPCDPYCQAFDNDTPEGISGDDIIATDAGITIGTGNNPGVQDFCSGGSYAECAHSICEPGGLPLMPGCDDNQTSCGTPTSWPSVDANMVVNPQITAERFGTYSPSWPKVEAPDREDEIATSDRYEVYNPPIPEEPADETLNGPETAVRFQDYTPIYPSAPANELVDGFQTENRFNFYTPSWPTAAPEEIVDEDATGSGSAFSLPNFPSTPATKTETPAKPYEDLDPLYPPRSPQVSKTQPGFRRFPFPTKPPTEVPASPPNRVWEYPVYPAEPKVEFVQAAYTDPAAAAPKAVEWVGSACGGYGTPHVNSSSCSPRPEAKPKVTKAWNRVVLQSSPPERRYRSQSIEKVAPGTIVDINMDAFDGDPDLYVNVISRHQITTHPIHDETNAQRGTHEYIVLPRPASACNQGSGAAKSAVDTSAGKYVCRPFSAGTTAERCRFYFATEASLAYMVDGAANLSDFSLTVVERPFDLWYAKLLDNERVGYGGVGGSNSALRYVGQPMDGQPGATAWNDCRRETSAGAFFELPARSIGVAVGWQRSATGQGRLALIGRAGSSLPTIGAPGCSPTGGVGLNQSASCMFFPPPAPPNQVVMGGSPANTKFAFAIYDNTPPASRPLNVASALRTDAEAAIFYPNGNCPNGWVADGQGNCCACSAGESSGGVCGADQCGVSCPAGAEVHGDRCFICPAGYKLNPGATQCVWDGLSCAGAVCPSGSSCKMVAGAPKCAPACDSSDSTAHPCSHDPNLCCGYKCNSADYSIVKTGENQWECSPRTNVCTSTADAACQSAPPANTHSCDGSKNPVQCRGDCATKYPGTTPFACVASPNDCCAHVCEAGYQYNAATDECEPILTIPCTAQATAYCQAQGANCVNDGSGNATCQEDYNCQTKYGAGFRSCNGGTQCCSYQCDAGYDYDPATHSCKPQTGSCTAVAQNACATMGSGTTCLVIDGKAQCRKPANCPSGQFAEGGKCYEWTCSAPYNYRNAAFSPPQCEHHDCSLPDVCDESEDEICEDTGPRAFPNERCRRLTGCPEPTHPCPFDENQCCKPHTCPPPGFSEYTSYNETTELCEWKSCAAPGTCNSGDLCLETGDFAEPNQQCRHDTGICGGATHLCGDECCYFTCPPIAAGQEHLTYRNIDQCEDRSCSACGGDSCHETYADGVLCREDLGCGNGTHECGPGAAQCCDYSCPPAAHPEFDHLEGTVCQRRNCDLCTNNGPEHECLATSPQVVCRKDLGCPAGSYECPDSPAACCKKSCAPPPIAGYDVLAWDERLGDACEYHGCDLCGADECLGPTADSGCKRDYGCGGGTYECGPDGLQCCDAICPPPGSPSHNFKVGTTCEARDCSACGADEICLGTSPNIQCCSGGQGCVAKVCQEDASCCNTRWSHGCVEIAKDVCDIDCIGLGPAATCAICYKDDKDHDGDGYSYADGDCMDCVAEPGLTTDFINPGAFEVPGNGIDDNCNGEIDEEPVCDTGLAMASANPFDYAKAMGLCEIQPPPGRWGVTEAKIVRSDASSAPHSSGYGVLPNFGPNLPPQQGNNIAVFSSGTARRRGDSGFSQPKTGRDFNTRSPYPQGYPRNTAGCPTPGGTANDSSGLWMKIRVPTNAKSFSYNFNFYSAEYKEWVCSAFNDSFVALLTSSHPDNLLNAGAPHYKNISFDGNNSPINVNNNFFQVTNQTVLAGSGFDGTGCYSGFCGASTGWLKSDAPVVPGEEITVHFSIWDTSDHIYDSTVLLDNWLWSAEEKPIKTQPDTPDPVVVEEGSFTRDYDASTLCADKPGTTPRWARWNWTALTPAGTRIQFFVKTAPTLAGLNTAPEFPLLFDNGWPAAMQNQHAEAKQASTAPTYSASSASGSTMVEHSLKTHGMPHKQHYLRIRSRLMGAPPEFTVAPTLQSWSLEVDCLPDQ